MRHVIAREIMSRPVITVRPDTPVRDIVTLMLRFGISGLPVVDADGRLLGIVSEADVIVKEEAPRPSPPALAWHGRSLWLERRVNRYRKAVGTTARDLMTENVVTAGDETSVRDLAHLMLSRGVNRIPIVTDGRVVGIVTRADILKVFTRSDDALVAAAKDALVHDLWIDPTPLAITCANGVLTVSGQVDRRSDRDLVLKWLRSIDGVVGVNGEDLTFRTDDLALGRVV